jgi:hypothetical protein
MGKHQNKVKNAKLEAWRNLEGAIWLIGLAILAIKGWWWPGILVLAAISVVYESILTSLFPSSSLEATEPVVEPAVPVEPAQKPTPVTVSHPTELLPANCPRCGAPTRGHEVHWTGDQAADCSFCGANLPLKRA